MTLFLSAADWRTRDDIYRALLQKLGAPDWHGHNLDAVWDGLVGGGIWAETQPLRISVSGTSSCPAPVRDHLKRLAALFSEARDKEGIDASFTLEE